VTARRYGSEAGSGFGGEFRAPGTCGVLNNEMIVPDPKQVLLKYLCEFR
jgi:hypothetical protein